MSYKFKHCETNTTVIPFNKNLIKIQEKSQTTFPKESLIMVTLK